MRCRPFCRILLTFALAQGAAAAPSKPTVENVLAAFHAEEFLSAAFGHVEEGIERREREIKVAKSRAKTMHELARRIYPGKNLLRVFKVAYAKQITLEHMTATYQWLNSPDGIKLRRAYDQVYLVDDSARFAYVRGPGKAVLKPNRQNALDTFLTNAKLADLASAWAIGADLAARRGFNGFLPAAEREPPKLILDALANRRRGYATAAAESIQAFAAYLFKDLKNSEIDTVSQFLASAAGEAHTRAFHAALEGTLKNAAATLEAQVAKQKDIP